MRRAGVLAMLGRAVLKKACPLQCLPSTRLVSHSHGSTWHDTMATTTTTTTEEEERIVTHSAGAGSAGGRVASFVGGCCHPCCKSRRMV
ncbi:hypothetical protein BC567DRAFT_225501 [Phyllosticta citribraziliensis]